MRQIPVSPRFWLAVFSFVLLVLAGAGLVNGRMASQRLAAEALARQGVTVNAGWQPFTTEIDGFTMALVPAGCFQMGSTPEQLGVAQAACDKYYSLYGCKVSFEDETPAQEVCFDQPYWMDVTEVSNRTYGGGYEGENWRDPRWPRETVTRAEAAVFCAGRGARLPTEAEWEYAARGPDGLLYPWGDEFMGEYVLWFSLVLQPVGSFPAGASWVGAQDLAGSIAEWMASDYEPYPLTGATSAVGVTRGGDWFAHAPYELRSTARFARPANFASTAVGFRCVLDMPGAD